MWLVISKNYSSQHSRKLSYSWASGAYRLTWALTFGYSRKVELGSDDVTLSRLDNVTCQPRSKCWVWMFAWGGPPAA